MCVGYSGGTDAASSSEEAEDDCRSFNRRRSPVGETWRAQNVVPMSCFHFLMYIMVEVFVLFFRMVEVIYPSEYLLIIYEQVFKYSINQSCFNPIVNLKKKKKKLRYQRFCVFNINVKFWGKDTWFSG